MTDAATTRLVVFSDDWGRHPSSCQHLISQLLPRYRTLWVNTIGTRPVQFSAHDLRRVGSKIRQWVARGTPAPAAALPTNLEVINPGMWPGFRTPWQRRLNQRLLCRAIHRNLGPRIPGAQRIAITTLPITADLVGTLDVDRWVYYCVDDFTTWPGVDHTVMQDMERAQVQKVAALIAVSRVLEQHLLNLRTARDLTVPLLTHGIDLPHWTTPVTSPLPAWWPHTRRPIFLFWGLLDPRLDLAWCHALAKACQRDGGIVLLVGPQQSFPDELNGLDVVQIPGPVAYDELPALASAADVLIMPYADQPATRAMQPLKFKEYLATGKAVVARRLPGISDWADSADLVDTADAFVERVQQRAISGLPADQCRARARLQQETWEHKAQQFAQVLLSAEDLP